MKCESTALGKYLETSKNIFFIYGSEVVLRNNAKDDVKGHLNKKGFFEKRIITKENFDQIENIIIESSGGSLFGSKIIIDIQNKKSIENFCLVPFWRRADLIAIVKSSLLDDISFS